MIGFHIDMNVAQFRGEYLEKWLQDLALKGYDTILWEVENNVTWETCPECVSPDAFSKKEFKRILALCRNLGMEPVPLLQTIGHSEYVLKHRKYAHLSEIEGDIGQYCPRNEELVPFLKEWEKEYLGVFGDVQYFHLGADEAWQLGKCDRCREYVEKHSLSELYIEHMNAVCEPVIDRGVTPIIWADMLLTHPEALEKMSRKVMLFDWRYSLYHGMGAVAVWGRGHYLKKDTPPEVMDEYGRYLYPMGDERGREPDPFYTADYLADNGFQVVGCPAASSAGDTVFTPMNWLHMINTYDWTHKGRSKNLHGSMLTSWTVRLVPWELQLAAIDLPGFVYKHPERSIASYQRFFMENRFGVDDDGFWLACGRLANKCLFMDAHDLGFDKACLPPPEDQVEKRLAKVTADEHLDLELDTASKRLDEYRQAKDFFESFAGRIEKGRDIIALWDLAARNLINRAEADIFLLSHKKAEVEKGSCTPPSKEEGAGILKRMKALRAETTRMYSESVKPTRRDEIISWIYDRVEGAISKLT